MTSQPPIQRFCPICNRGFEAAEAVLRCEGCDVLHHPACWVRNGGCATPSNHRVMPVAMAYEGTRPLAAEAPRPGEGTKRAEPPDPIPFDPRQTVGGQEPELGAAPARPSAPKRYVPPTERSAPMKPMPKVYNRHRLLAYWYVPAAIVVAVVVALAVIWVAEQLGAGDGGSGAQVAVAPERTASAPAASTSTTPALGTTPSASGTPLSGTPGAGKFKVGDRLVVSGTGDCLNIRSGPARSNEATACLADGVEITVLDGPQTGDQLTWWKVHTPQGDGWAAEDYLAKKP